MRGGSPSALNSRGRKRAAGESVKFTRQTIPRGLLWLAPFFGMRA
jgi:hypothetical protein